MATKFYHNKSLFSSLVAIALCLPLTGCHQNNRFEPDRVYCLANGLTAAQSTSIDQVLTEQFGTPASPSLPEEVTDWLDLASLQQAAGKVASNTPGVTQGLYGRHCARCHGLTGNGRGPTSLHQSPYPRDFRQAVFKWKSTYRDALPTDADLDHTIKYGLAGSSMPSFALLAEDERNTLRQYVQYLALRGQLERELIMFVAEELPLGEPFTNDEPFIGETISRLVANWQNASEQIVEALPLDDSTEAIARGEALYHSERSGCVKCHGKQGNGIGVADTDYDLWSGQRVELLRNADKELAKQLSYDLPPIVSIGRALEDATLRGSDKPADLYRRLHQGIAGSPMPAVGSLTPDGRGALEDQEIADLTSYVSTLVRKDRSTEDSPSIEGDSK